MKRVLVAGATGYLGGFVVQELKTRGYFVRAMARSPEKLNHRRCSVDEITRAEVTQAENLEHVCDGIDVVFSSIGITKQKDKHTVAGPEILTYREIAELAFQSLGKPVRITSVPVWVVKLAIAVTMIVSKHRGELLAFFTTAMTSDVVAPVTGLRSLAAHFKEE